MLHVLMKAWCGDFFKNNSILMKNYENKIHLLKIAKTVICRHLKWPLVPVAVWCHRVGHQGVHVGGRVENQVRLAWHGARGPCGDRCRGSLPSPFFLLGLRLPLTEGGREGAMASAGRRGQVEGGREGGSARRPAPEGAGLAGQRRSR
jgi:hypothetical protein